jgi:hypothetical protein
MTPERVRRFMQYTESHGYSDDDGKKLVLDRLLRTVRKLKGRMPENERMALRGAILSGKGMREGDVDAEGAEQTFGRKVKIYMYSGPYSFSRETKTGILRSMAGGLVELEHDGTREFIDQSRIISFDVDMDVKEKPIRKSMWVDSMENESTIAKKLDRRATLKKLPLKTAYDVVWFAGLKLPYTLCQMVYHSAKEYIVARNWDKIKTGYKIGLGLAVPYLAVNYVIDPGLSAIGADYIWKDSVALMFGVGLGFPVSKLLRKSSKK